MPNPISYPVELDCECCGEVEAVCCDGYDLPGSLFATVDVNGDWCDGSGIDGAVIEIVWDGVDRYYGEIDTDCTNCTKFYVSLQCTAGGWLFSFGFTGPGTVPPDA